MTVKRRQYTAEFKKEAVEHLLSSGETGRSIAEKLGIRNELLYRWRREYQQKEEKAFPGSGKLGDPTEARIRELEKRARDAEEEREILKKALAIFSKRTR